MSKKVQKFEYPIDVFWSEEDEGYIAVIPDLLGCSAWGKTEEQALQEVQEAAKAWIKVAIKVEGDTFSLPPLKTFSAKKIKELRLKEKVSQSVFAKFLNASLSTVQRWERGKCRPRGASLVLLNLVSKKGLEIFGCSVGIKASV